MRRLGRSRDGAVVYRLLKAAHFVENAEEAAPERRQQVLHFDRRLFAEHRATEDAETHHLAQSLVHHLRRQARARPKKSARPRVSARAKLEQADRPFAADDVLDHRGDGDGTTLLRFAQLTDGRAALNHDVTTLPKSAFLTPARSLCRIHADGACPSAPNPTRPEERAHEPDAEHSRLHLWHRRGSAVSRDARRLRTHEEERLVRGRGCQVPAALA